MSNNILHIVDSLRPGGAETIAVNTCNALNKDGGVTAYLCSTRLKGELINNIDKLDNYIFLEKKKALDGKALAKLKRFILENDISIIHAHTTSFFIAVQIKLKLKHLKIVWHNHTGANVNLSGWRKLFLQTMSRFFHIVINVNEDLNVWTKKNLKMKQSVFLRNFAAFANDEKLTTLKGNASNKLVCLAGLRFEKDHLTLLNAFKIVRERYSDISLHIVGKDYQNEYSEQIKSFIKTNDLSESVFLYDNRLDIAHILSQATIGVLSSKTEGLPVALLEYGLSKLPVIVTNVGDCPKLINDGINGRVVEKENSIVFANVILELLNDDSLRKQFGLQLEKTVESDYAIQTYIDSIKEIYTNL